MRSRRSPRMADRSRCRDAWRHAGALHGLIAGQARACRSGEGPALGLAGTPDLAAPEHGRCDLLASRIVAQFEQGLRLVADDAFVLPRKLGVLPPVRRMTWGGGRLPWAWAIGRAVKVMSAGGDGKDGPADAQQAPRKAPSKTAPHGTDAEDDGARRMDEQLTDDNRLGKSNSSSRCSTVCERDL